LYITGNIQPRCIKQLEEHAIRKNSNYKALCRALLATQEIVAELQHGSFEFDIYLVCKTSTESAWQQRLSSNDWQKQTLKQRALAAKRLLVSYFDNIHIFPLA
jgi:hypothetical protein